MQSYNPTENFESENFLSFPTFVSAKPNLFSAMGSSADLQKASTPVAEEVQTHDDADLSAIGGHLEDLPPGYYRSPKFVGSIIGVVLMANSLYLGFVLPVRVSSLLSCLLSRDRKLTFWAVLQSNTLSVINADLGLLHSFVPRLRHI